MYSICVAVEFRTLRSHDGVGLEYFHDFRRGSRCGAKRFGVGGMWSHQNETQYPSETQKIVK